MAGAIVAAGLRLVTSSSRVLVDEALPQEELDAVREAIERPRAPRWSASTRCARAAPAAAATSTCTCSSATGTTLERAHEISHELQNAIRARLRGADVLIHLEPRIGSPSRAT